MASRSWFLKSVLWLVLILVVLLLFVLPVLTSLVLAGGYRLPAGIDKFLNSLQWLQIHTMKAFTLVWIFFVGSCFASFLNVVAWRVPRGKSILGSSHCPHCNLKLTFRDNVPIVGWLRNGGRCSRCKTPITVRYLVAELVLGSAYLALFLREVATGGANLPFRQINQFTGIENILFDPDWNLLAIFGFHLLLLSLLFTITMIASEKRKIPFSVLIFGIAAGVTFLVFHRAVNLVQWRLWPWNESIPFSNSTVDLCIALTMGLATAIIAATAIGYSAKQIGNNDVDEKNLGLTPVLASMILVGICLGWQTVVSVSVIYFLVTLCFIFLVCCDTRYRFANASGRILISVLLHLMIWRQQDTYAWWCGPNATSLGAICCAVCTFLSTFIFSRFAGFLGKDAATPGDLG